MKKLLIALLFISLTACHSVPAWKQNIFERPVGNKNYHPLYITGWKHGCESGAEASSNHLYRIKYDFTQDWKLLNNPQYLTGWENAYNFCRKYILNNNLKKW